MIPVADFFFLSHYKFIYFLGSHIGYHGAKKKKGFILNPNFPRGCSGKVTKKVGDGFLSLPSMEEVIGEECKLILVIAFCFAFICSYGVSFLVSSTV